MRLWDMRTFKLRCELQAHRHVAQSCAFSADGTLLASAGLDHRVVLWNPHNGELVRELRGSEWTNGGACALSPDSKMIATGTAELRVSRVEDGELVWESWNLNGGWASIDAEGRVRGDERGLEHVVYTDPDERALIPTLWHASDVSEEFRMTPKPRYRELKR